MYRTVIKTVFFGRAKFINFKERVCKNMINARNLSISKCGQLLYNLDVEEVIHGAECLDILL